MNPLDLSPITHTRGYDPKNRASFIVIGILIGAHRELIVERHRQRFQAAKSIGEVCRTIPLTADLVAGYTGVTVRFTTRSVNRALMEIEKESGIVPHLHMGSETLFDVLFIGESRTAKAIRQDELSALNKDQKLRALFCGLQNLQLNRISVS